MKKLLPVVSLVVIVACGAPAEPEPRPAGSPVTDAPAPASSAPTTAAATEVELWFVDDERLFPVRRTITKTARIGAAALNELFDGPVLRERRVGASTAIPRAAELLSLEIAGGTATVDVSESFVPAGGSFAETMVLAQLTYTITQFRSVRRVELEIGGERVDAFGSHGTTIEDPMTRRDFYDVLPAIAVTQPGAGQAVTSPVTIAGLANVFEATVSWRITDRDGHTIKEGFVTATCGSGCWGTFEDTISLERQRDRYLTLQVFESSAEDGSPLNMVEMPLNFRR